MPPVILILLLVAGSLFLTNLLVLIPLQLISTFNIPNWVGIMAIALLLCWCFPDD